jgi:hypothetical protein
MTWPIVSVMGTVPPAQRVDRQLASSSGETNERLDRLIAEQQRTNQLLEWLGGLITAATEKPARDAPTVRTSSVARRIDRHIELE